MPNLNWQLLFQTPMDTDKPATASERNAEKDKPKNISPLSPLTAPLEKNKDAEDRDPEVERQRERERERQKERERREQEREK